MLKPRYALILLCAIFGGLAWWGLFPKTSLWLYRPTISELKKQHSTASIFPDSIPPTAKNARFYYAPGGLQSSPRAFLSLVLPADQFAGLRARYAEKNQPLADHDVQNLLRGSFPRQWEPGLHQPTIPFTSRYQSYLISPNLQEARDNWNHPENAGISFSKNTTEVIYWFN